MDYNVFQFHSTLNLYTLLLKTVNKFIFTTFILEVLAAHLKCNIVNICVVRVEILIRI